MSYNKDQSSHTLDYDKKKPSPIGTILAWTPLPDLETLNPVEIPDGWLECDGSMIQKGIWIGRRTPDLNGSKRFLRGGVIGDALRVEEDTVNADQLNYKDWFYNGFDKCSDSGYTLKKQVKIDNKDNPDFVCERTEHLLGSSSETKPKNMNVVFIIKVY